MFIVGRLADRPVVRSAAAASARKGMLLDQFVLVFLQRENGDPGVRSGVHLMAKVTEAYFVELVATVFHCLRLIQVRHFDTGWLDGGCPVMPAPLRSRDVLVIVE